LIPGWLLVEYSPQIPFLADNMTAADDRKHALTLLD
jgi:hypothetical protein